jgi:hypothetical protein
MVVPRTPHPAETKNRTTKAWALVAALRDIGVTADDAAHMTDEAWMRATRLAESYRGQQFARVGRPVPPLTAPSAETRRLVVKMLAGSSNPAAVDPVVG